ncbi:hypothetical protein SAMN05216555_11250 [Arthrobacter cupressi]|uniref:Uncharacterized protein n=1 Tax=Arthrobacter cupressi TaxID=1045773 RepID=A0A1G8UMK4_9MICC|nr:hypothetical protein SAMN05216555_11250 [Arthrobacter cupressi]
MFLGKSVQPSSKIAKMVIHMGCISEILQVQKVGHVPVTDESLHNVYSVQILRWNSPYRIESESCLYRTVDGDRKVVSAEVNLGYISNYSGTRQTCSHLKRRESASRATIENHVGRLQA